MPAIRPGLMCRSAKPTRPNWSTSGDATVCPATTSAIRVAAPSFGAVTIDPAT
jgi:hypothetical protein